MYLNQKGSTTEPDRIRESFSTSLLWATIDNEFSPMMGNNNQINQGDYVKVYVIMA